MYCKTSSSPLQLLIFVTFVIVVLFSICNPVCFGQAIENFNASHLTLSNFYTFAHSDSHINLVANGTISEKLILSKREFDFEFRTRYPNGILVYESVYLNSSKNSFYDLFLTLQSSQFKVVLQYGDRQDELLVGYGFNRDNLHRVNFYINPQLGFLNVRVNSNENLKYYKSLYFNSSLFRTNETSLANYQYGLTIGAIPVTNRTSNLELSYKKFVGCIGKFNIVSRSDTSSFGTLALSHLQINNVVEGCVDQCQQLNLCSRKSRCINNYDSKSCDCFGTELEDWHCRSFNYTVVTLRGFSTISYKIYQFSDKFYSNEHRVSMHIKTKSDGLLFAALSENFQNYLILNIKNGFLNLMFNLNKNPKNYIFNNFKLIDNQWHNVTIVHHHWKLFVFLDLDFKHDILLDETNTYFYFDPEIYFGGFPSNLNISLLNLPLQLPNRKFVGCLKHVYFNSINVLYNLNSNYKEATYHSLLPIELGCSVIDSLPITIRPKSYFKLPFNRTIANTLEFEFEFKSLLNNFRIVNGSFLDNDGERKLWYLQVQNHDVKLHIRPEQTYSKQIDFTLSNDNSLNRTTWNKIIVSLKEDGFIHMTANKLTIQGKYNSHFGSFSKDMSFGSIDNNLPFAGCIQNVVLDNRPIDPIILSENKLIFGKVTLDNCKLVNPCNLPNACEHGGRCIANHENATYRCDCTNTGYIGRTCHFSVYQRSCEEINLNKQPSGIYMIDIDRNGPLPPSHVICLFGEDGSSKTIIEHNIQHQVIVREKGKHGSFYMHVVYRDFNAEMLQLLISRSNQCKQYVKYECNDAPLSLSSYTMLYSTLPDHKVARIEGTTSRGCMCAVPENKCVDPRKQCNCDAESPGWKHDEGYLTNPQDVGITKMYFFQFPNITKDSEAHLFIGNLSCIDSNTQQYEITFKTKESYLEVPGWTGREMTISFLTTASKAVIFYQAHLDSLTTYFKAVIISETEVSFEYSLLNQKSVITVSSSHCLNCGKWQHLRIERNDNQMRVSINRNFKIMNLKKNEKFIDFDGKLFVGGAPIEYLKGLKITLGFIGCLRGLVFNNEIINLFNYLDIRKPNIESGCRPYCQPNLCQNKGECVELWGSYECKCANPVAHTGKNCEINMNTNSITFKKATSIRQIKKYSEIKSILSRDIILSFRTHARFALLLYAHDINNNFVQIHIENGSHLVFTYNSHRKIARGEINLSSYLVSGNTIQMKIDRSHKNSSLLIVNKDSVIIPYPLRFLKEYSLDKYWFAEKYKLNQVNVNSIGRNELFIGGAETESETISLIPGFVGCLQGLKMGDNQFDLQQTAIEMNNANNNAVKPGCNMLCDQFPCKNGGICTEDWENDSIKCHCESTSYRGDLCDIDIGAYFQRNSSVFYYLDFAILDFDYIDIAFAFASSHQEDSTLLLLRYANSTRYLHIALMANGQILVDEDNGHNIYQSTIESEEGNFLDSNRHWIQYTRKGKSGKIILDSWIYEIEEILYRDTNRQIPPTSENIILVGSSKINNQNFAGFSNFRGCISNMNIVLDELKIDPFESAFGIRSGLSRVKVFGDVKQSICASFGENRQITPIIQIEEPSILNREEIWLNRPKPTLHLYNKTDIHNQSKSYLRTYIIFAASSIYLFVVCVLVAIYIYRIDKRYKLIKFQGETPFFHKKTRFYKIDQRM